MSPRNILFALLLSTLGVQAQSNTGPTLPGVPVAPGATNRQERLRQALRAAAETNSVLAAPGLKNTNTVTVDPRSGAVRTNTIAVPAAPGPGPASPVPTTPGTNAAPVTGPGPGEVAIPPSGANADVAADDLLPAGTINFPGTDLKDVLKIYAELVNRTVLRPAQLPAAQIVLITQTPLTRREAIAAFDSVLALNGIGMINVGDKFVKAVPQQQVISEGAPFNRQTADQLPEIGQFLTHVVQLKHTKPTEMVQALTPFAKIPNAILPIDSSQILVLRDYTENVKRMLEMIKEIDVAVPSEFISEVIPIKYALSSEIANALNSLSSGGGGATVGGTGTGAGGTGMTGSRMSGSRGGFGTGTTGVGTMGGIGGYRQGGIGGGMMNPQAGMTGTAGGTGGTFTDRLQNIIRRASVSGDVVVLGSTKIIADERTNSLLIFASREDMKMIKDIVAKLDVVLAQVLIEAVVIEVNIGDNKERGISWLEKKLHGTGQYSGIGAIGNTKFLQASDIAAGGTNAAAALGGLNYLGRFNQDLEVTITAVADDSRARILQRPRIQTSHAVEANLFVGESRPYPTASYYGGGAYGGYSSIQQLQIGVTLSVTPLINPDGLVVMDIHQTIESANGEVNIANVGAVPITSRKEAAAKVAVRDRDTIILGGLIEDSNSKSGSGVPFLKDIPLLGNLFRNSSSKNRRNELIVLIRPTVLPTPEVAALAAVSEKSRMPEVSRAESEMRAQEAVRLKKAEEEARKLKEKGTD